MFSSASSFARKFSLAIVVTLFVSLQVPAASATTAIPEDGFYDCATGVKRADSNATGFRIENGNVSNIDCTGDVVLPDGLTYVGFQAFQFSGITSITIPYGVTAISDFAFFGSMSLSTVVLPSTLQYIGYLAFAENPSLTSVTIPANVTYIEEAAFENVSSLKDVYFLGNAPDFVAYNALSGFAAGAKVHITSAATGFGNEETWNGLIVDSSPNYSYEFIERGGSIVHGGTFTAGGSIQTPPQSERAGYTFMGWAATLGGSALSFPYSPGVNQGIILYALWSAKTHTVTFDSLGGSAVTEQTFVTGGTVSEPTPPTRSGYTFEGWADSAGSALSFPYTPSNPQDLTLYAQWSADSHTVTFNSMGGSPIAADSFSSGGSIDYSPSVSPTKLFDDVIPDGVSLIQVEEQYQLGNLVSTSRAGWVKKVRYYRSSGDDSAISASIWSSEGELLESQVFIGGTESGWQSLTLDDPVFIAANETFYVTVLTPTTPYSVGLGTIQSSLAPLSLIGVTASNPAQTIEEPLSGIFVLVDLEFETKSAPTPTRAGYTFNGWSATDGGSVISYPYSPGVMEDITLYANWSINTYSITFNSKGGTSVAAGSFVYGGQTASAPAAPTRTGYVFAGWSDTDGGSAISFPYSPSVASNVTLYAKWTSLPPVMGRTSATTLLPGDLVSLNVSRVTKGCTITVGWAESNTGVTPVSKVVKADRSTGAFTIASPATAGTYTLSTNLISSECAGGSAVTLTQSVVVGKSLNLTAKVSTSSAYVSKNPTLTLSGSVKSGSVAVVGKQFSVSLRRNGVDVETVTATTSSSGVLNVSFTRVTYSGGAYTVEISSAADTTYLATTFTTAKLTLRGQGYNAI
jgi:uncharacterized repeat protein (TIGR02543 family)